MLCEKCKDAFGRVHETLGERFSQNFTLHENFQSFQLSIDGGCTLCNAVVEEFKSKTEPGKWPPQAQPSLVYAIYCNDDLFPQHVRFSILDNEGQVSDNDIFLQITNTPDDYVDPTLSVDPLLAVPEMHQVDGFVYQRPSRVQKKQMEHGLSQSEMYPLENRTGSQKSLTLARAWLTACHQHHPECATSSMDNEHFFPKRVLNVDDPSNIKLCEHLTPGKDSYVTLSHRWGTEKPIQLTAATANMLKAGIDVSQFPQTFQDAIYITRGLSLRFIWIDSLCIQQDSMEDWKEQAALMGDIYKYGACNIAASISENAFAGIFSTRNGYAVEPTILSLQWTGASGLRWGPQEKSCMIRSSPWEDGVEDSILSTRGWIFQERLLSPRVLHFTSKQVFWECRCSAACESLPSGRPYIAPPGSPFKNLHTNIDKWIETRSLENMEDMNKFILFSSLLTSWNDVIKHYSSCEFTRLTDKLIALEGVRKEMTRAVGNMGDYIAGHWTIGFPFELLWAVGEENAQQPGLVKIMVHSTRPKDPAHIIAPTWSWASIVGPIAPCRWHLSPHTRSTINTKELKYGQILVSGRMVHNLENVLDSYQELTCFVADAQLGIAMHASEHGGPVVFFRKNKSLFRLRKKKDEFDFAAQLAPDEKEDLPRLGKIQAPGKLIVVLVFQLNPSHIEGLLLERLDTEDTEAQSCQNGKKIQGGKDKKFCRYERRGRFQGSNLASKDGSWGISSKKLTRRTVRIF